MMRTATVAEGLAFPEGPRWREGRLWLTDQHARAVQAMTPDGRLDTVARTPDLPGGLGWLPDGTLLAVQMTERRLVAVTPAGLRTYAELSGLASWHCNDMVADHHGRVYVGNFGFDLHGGAPPAPAELVLVPPGGAPEAFAADLVFPNGSAITPDGGTLLVAETFAHRVTAFGLDPGGRAASRAVWAELGDATPDGICLDAAPCGWPRPPPASCCGCAAAARWLTAAPPSARPTPACWAAPTGAPSTSAARRPTIPRRPWRAGAGASRRSGSRSPGQGCRRTPGPRSPAEISRPR